MIRLVRVNGMVPLVVCGLLLTSPLAVGAPSPQRKAPAKKAPVHAAIPPSDTQNTDEDSPTIQLSAAKQRVHHAKPQACELWIDPERGFVDSCDPPQAAQGETPLEVITLDKGEWLEALPENEASSEEQTAAEDAPLAPEGLLPAALDALPQVITTWAEPLLEVVTLDLDTPQESPDKDNAAPSPVAQVVENVSQAVTTVTEAVAKTLTAKPAEAPMAQPNAVAQVQDTLVNPMAQPQSPLSPITLAPAQGPAMVMMATASEPVTSQTVQPSPEPAPEVARTEAIASHEPQTETQEAKPAKPQKPSWRYRHQPKPQYDWPKNPVSQVVKRVVALIHWIFG